MSAAGGGDEEDPPRVDPFAAGAEQEPQIRGAWPPAAKLLFVVVASGLLWAAIYMAFRWIF